MGLPCSLRTLKAPTSVRAFLESPDRLPTPHVRMWRLTCMARAELRPSVFTQSRAYFWWSYPTCSRSPPPTFAPCSLLTFNISVPQNNSPVSSLRRAHPALLPPTSDCQTSGHGSGYVPRGWLHSILHVAMGFLSRYLHQEIRWHPDRNHLQEAQTKIASSASSPSPPRR